MYTFRSQYISCFCFVLFLDQGSAWEGAKTKAKTHYPWRQWSVHEWARGRAFTKVQRQVAIQRGSRHGTGLWPRAAHILGRLRREGSACVSATGIADDQAIRGITNDEETVSEQGEQAEFRRECEIAWLASQLYRGGLLKEGCAY